MTDKSKEKEVGFEFDFDDKHYREAKIAVVGIGGAGGNAVNTLFAHQLPRVTYIIANTDVQVLSLSPVPLKIQLGETELRGQGTGGNFELGRKAAKASADMISEILNGYDIVFLCAGLGGGTGTGAIPVFAEIAHELGCLTIAVVTRPFSFDGIDRINLSNRALKDLSEFANSIMTINNDKLMELAGDLEALDGIRKADEVLVNAVNGIVELIKVAFYKNTDLNDLKSTLKGEKCTYALMGSASAQGPDRAIEAAQRAIECPLLTDISICGAKSLLINVIGGKSMKFNEVGMAINTVKELSAPEAKIIWGFGVDESLGDAIKVSIVAGGFERPFDESDRVKTRSKTAMLVSQMSASDTVPVSPTYQGTASPNATREIPTYIRKQQETLETVSVPSYAPSRQTTSTKLETYDARRGSSFETPAYSPNPRYSQPINSLKNRMTEVAFSDRNDLRAIKSFKDRLED